MASGKLRSAVRALAVTAEELRNLASWDALFGERFSSLLVFAYNVVGDLPPLPADELFPFRGGLYGFVGLNHYASWANPLSERWGTVSVPAGKFRSLAQGLHGLLRHTPPNRAGSGLTPWPFKSRRSCLLGPAS